MLATITGRRSFGHLHSGISLLSMLNPRFLVVSIGNPLPKYESLHSAGHFALNGLAQKLGPVSGALDGQTAFKKVNLGKHKCLMFHHPKYTLAQSPTLMNVSGGFVLRVWQEMLGQQDPASLSLVVVHDELERDLGNVRLTPWDQSPRGHNGIKSIKSLISQDKFPQSPLARIAVGIGRPAERDPDIVSRYVLKQITAEQRQVLEEEVPLKVLDCLRDLEDQWKAELGQ